MAAHSILIIGGGAAGLAAGVTAAWRGAKVRILERMSRVGKKLLATGNGRCNLANRDLRPEFFHGSCAGDFAAEVFRQFDLQRTLAFFRKLGVEPRVEEDGLIYPASGQASSVLEVLRYELDRLGVETVCDTNVQRIERQIARRGAEFVCSTADGGRFEAARVILAAGGKSSPNFGSNGGGFKLAEALGHTIAEPFPALVPVTLDAPFLKHLDGVRISARVAACVDGLPHRAETGELQLTEYGASGIVVFQLSRIFADPQNRGRDLALCIDLFPDMADAEELARMLAARFAASPEKSLEFSLVGLLHKKLIPVVWREAGQPDPIIPCGQIGDAAIKRLAALLKNWRLSATGTQSWMHSQVTAGGVIAKEVIPQTLESRLVPGLFFCGEVLDLDGDCGGYTLQWAWSSAHIAATPAAE